MFEHLLNNNYVQEDVIKRTPFGVLCILYYMKAAISAEEIKENYRYKNTNEPMYAQVFIPKMNTAIYYEETYKSKKDQKLKEKQLCYERKNRIRVIRVIEANYNAKYGDTIYIKNSVSYKECLEDAIRTICKLLKLNIPDIDIKRDLNEIRYKKNKTYKEENTIEVKEVIVKEQETKTVKKKETTMDNREEKLIKGFNDFATKRPELLKDWDYRKNKDVRPEDIYYKSLRTVWWKSEDEQGYEMSIKNKTEGKKSPYENKQMRIENGYNLTTQNPEVLKYWDYEKNTIKPNEVTRASKLKVWWKCPDCGHTWEAGIDGRAKAKYGCPKCRKE